jgi:uncharacterized membrane protein
MTSENNPLGTTAAEPVIKKRAGVHGTERILAFSDGVFAIVITLLVLEITVPAVTSAELLPALRELLPAIAAHVVTFALLGVYWIGHHAVFTLIKRYDRPFLWLNLLYLFFVASMPFPTALVIHYNDQLISYIIYCSVLIMAGLSANLLWHYASKNGRLLGEHVSGDAIAITNRRLMLVPIVYLLALLTAFINLNITKVFLVLAILFFVVPNPLTTHHSPGHADAFNDLFTEEPNYEE